MGINFIPNYFVDITKFFEDKKKAILAHNSQNPKKFLKAVELQNTFRAAQCNYGEGNYVEAYRFEKSFPFSNINSLIPHNIQIKPYYENNENSLI